MMLKWLRSWAQEAKDEQIEDCIRRRTEDFRQATLNVTRFTELQANLVAELELLRKEKALRLIDKLEKAGEDPL